MILIDEQVLAIPPYALDKTAKAALFRKLLGALTRHHMAQSEPYRAMMRALDFTPADHHEIADYPGIPARLFKSHDLKSVSDADVKKIMTSSGTSGQSPSRIFLDGETAALQTKVLSHIVGDFIGTQRLPMLVIDAPSTVKAAGGFSARAAGIIGFSLFGRDVTYALKDDMSLDLQAVNRFAEKYRGQKKLLFGFTFIVYLHLLKALEEAGARPDLSDGILIHGGGWKKMIDIAVSNALFKQRLKTATGIARIHNYYGTIEQTGSIFVECEQGHLHGSNFSDIITRDRHFAPLAVGQKGLVSMLSLLPHSYPGHVLLTEDEGTILGEDDCPCGRKGKYFHIHGRVPLAEARGCSDTYAVR